MRALLAAAVLTIALPTSASAARAHPNQAPKVSLDPAVAAAGGRVIGLINSGQRFHGGTFQGIPDGLGIVPVGKAKKFIDIYVAFEQSHVPFGGFADLQDSSVMRARLDVNTKEIVGLTEVLPPEAGFVRFCSATMVGPVEGFDDYTFMVNEESLDWLPVPAGASYGADPSLLGTAWGDLRQAGYSVWLDTSTGEYDTIPGLGRMNHENTVVVPGGWDGVVALTGDDTFNAPSSQLYLYGASSPEAFKQDQGSLWAFQVTGADGVPLPDEAIPNPLNDLNDYLELLPGHNYQGRFIPVPPDIARGTTGTPPQDALETWSNANNVFQFVRVEDIAYDPDSPRTVYFTDTGTTRLKESTTGPTAGRLIRAGSSAFPYFNSDGRVFKMLFSAGDPTVVESLSILAQGRLQEQTGTTTFNPIDPGVGFVNPDNLAVGRNTLMVQEDNSTLVGGTLDNGVWQHPLGSTSWKQVATAVQHTTAETSGIVDASNWLGAGWWVLDVQSHVNLDPPGSVGSFKWDGPIYPFGPVADAPYSQRIEDGQLLLMFIPGS